MPLYRNLSFHVQIVYIDDVFFSWFSSNVLDANMECIIGHFSCSFGIREPFPFVLLVLESQP
jgi:hypothetical protein